MRRALTVLVLVGLVGAMLAESAAAGSLTVRTDPNDARGELDIRKV